jgi:hypothetical protein
MFRKPTQSPMLGKELLLKRLEENDLCAIARFDSYPIYPADIERLLKIIERHTNLRLLSFVDCQLTSKDILVITRQVLKNKHLQVVNFELFDNDNLELRQAIVAMNEHLENNLTHSRSFSPKL